MFRKRLKGDRGESDGEGHIARCEMGWKKKESGKVKRDRKKERKREDSTERYYWGKG